MPISPLMKQTRMQLLQLIQVISDPYQQQNTAAIVRNVLETMVNNMHVKEDDTIQITQVTDLTTILGNIQTSINLINQILQTDNVNLDTFQEFIDFINGFESGSWQEIDYPAGGIVTLEMRRSVIVVDASTTDKPLYFPDPLGNPQAWYIVRRTDTNIEGNAQFYVGADTSRFEDGAGINLMPKNTVQIKSNGANYTTLSH